MEFPSLVRFKWWSLGLLCSWCNRGAMLRNNLFGQKVAGVESKGVKLGVAIGLHAACSDPAQICTFISSSEILRRAHSGGPVCTLSLLRWDNETTSFLGERREKQKARGKKRTKKETKEWRKRRREGGRENNFGGPIWRLIYLPTKGLVLASDAGERRKGVFRFSSKDGWNFS